VDSHLAAMQEQLLEDGANTILDWFCSFPEEVASGGEQWPGAEALASFPDVSSQIVEMSSHPCMGAAGLNQDPIRPSVYSSHDREVARHVAYQAVKALQPSNSALQGQVVNAAQFNASNPDRCCDQVLFAVHPVFGVFLKTRLPLVDKLATEEVAAESAATRTVCFRRKWIPKPVVTPLTYKSDVDHLFHPEKLVGKAARQLAAPAAAAPAATGLEAGGTRSMVHFILPFRARNLGSLPALVRTLGVANLESRFEVTQKEGADKAVDHSKDLVRLVIVPVEEESDYMEGVPVMQRVQEVVAAASPQVHFNITLASNLPADKGGRMHLKTILHSWIKPYIKARAEALKSVTKGKSPGKAVAGQKGKEASVNPDAGGRTVPAEDISGTLKEAAQQSQVLPSAWLRAVVTGLAHVPSASARVFVLDSSTSAVSASLARKVLWRVIEGSQAFVPAPYTISEDSGDDDQLIMLLRDGGVTMTPEQVESALTAAGLDPKADTMDYRKAEFYGWHDPTEGGGSAGVDPAQRVLRGAGAPAGAARRLAQVDEAEFATKYGSDSVYGTGVRSYTPGKTADGLTDAYKQGYDSAGSVEKYAQSFGTNDDGGDDWASGHTALTPHHGEDDEVLPLPASSPQFDRMTALGTTKIDLASAVAKMLEHLPAVDAKSKTKGDAKKPAAGKAVRRQLQAKPAEEAPGADAQPVASPAPVAAKTDSDDGEGSLEMGDQCVMRRILLEYQRNSFTLARTLRAGYRISPVDYGIDGTPIVPAEMGPCECSAQPHWPHCEVLLPLSSVDDQFDKDRVNCAITQMTAAADAAEAAAKAKAAVKGKAQRVLEGGAVEGTQEEVPVWNELVHVDHPVRYFEPHRGLKIVTKVARKEVVANGAETGRPVVAESFSFQWYLTEKAWEFAGNDDDLPAAA